MNESVQIADLRIETERVDDIPLVVAQMRRMELPEVLDSRVVPHGNRRGLSIGWTVVVWLAHVLSEADHRLSQVRPWAAQRPETLRACTGQELREEDLSDDRLADALRALADDETWVNVEQGLVLNPLAGLRPASEGRRPDGRARGHDHGPQLRPGGCGRPVPVRARFGHRVTVGVSGGGADRA